VMVGCLGFGGLALAEDAKNLEDSGTILPIAASDCTGPLKDFTKPNDKVVFMKSLTGAQQNSLLGCAITTGRASLDMVPYFIQYFANYLLGIVALIAVLFTVIGGVFWTVGGIGSQKEKGKKYITEAIIGMSISLLAWAIVNVILSAFTG